MIFSPVGNLIGYEYSNVKPFNYSNLHMKPPSSLPESYPMCHPIRLLKLQSFFLLTYFKSPTLGWVALLRILISVWPMELGRRTDRRSSPIEQTPPAQAGSREEVGKNLT